MAKPVKALVTRPAEDARELAARLRAKGIDPVLAPVLQITPQPATLPPLEGTQAIILTSANGARALAAATPRRDLAIIAVGQATATAARAAAFSAVATAGGDVEQLAAFITACCRPDAGRLLHVCGTVTAGDLAGRLTRAGFTIEPVALYRAEPVEQLPQAALASIRKGEIGFLILMSPRTASLFCQKAIEAGIEDHLRTTQALCLSQPVADALTIEVAARHVAKTPSLEALLALLDTPNATVSAAMTSTNARPRHIRALWVTVALLGIAVLGRGAWDMRDSWDRSSTPAPAAVPSSAATQPTIDGSQIAAQIAEKITPQITARLDLLEAEDRAYRQRLDSLEKTPPAPAMPSTPAPAPVAPLSLEDNPTIKDLAGRLVAAAQTQETLAARLSLIEERTADIAAATTAANAAASAAERRALLALSIANLVTASETGRPFATQWGMLARLAQETPTPEMTAAIADLQPLAVVGVPTPAALQRQFLESTPAIKRAEQVNNNDASGWWGEVVRLAGALVTIRRTDQPTPGTVDEILARTQAALMSGELATAAQALAELTPPPQAAAQTLRHGIEQRILLERSRETLGNQALEILERRTL